jgi:hypothetical protein
MFLRTLPRFADSLLALDRPGDAAAEEWGEIQLEMRFIARRLERAIAALDEARNPGGRSFGETWTELRNYLVVKRDAFRALMNAPLPDDLQKCGRDLLELCRAMDSWSQGQVDMIDAPRAAAGKPPILAGYGGR